MPNRAIQDECFSDICILGGKIVHLKRTVYFDRLPNKYKKKWRKLEKALVKFINENLYNHFI